jgi:hypothetical protein
VFQSSRNQQNRSQNRTPYVIDRRALNIVIPFAEHDHKRVMEWLTWCGELCGLDQRHTLWLMPFKGIDCKRCKNLAKNCFSDVKELPDVEGIVSNWEVSANYRDASGPNSMFRQAVRYFSIENVGPWFFCEPDCIPLKAEWIDSLEREYAQCHKPFMGVIPSVPNISAHLNGAAIYPANALNICPILGRASKWQDGHEIAFDFAARNEILPISYQTRQIQFHYPAASFNTISHIPIDPDSVLFHSSRDGSLIRLLRYFREQTCK